MTPPGCPRSVALRTRARHVALFLSATLISVGCARGVNYTNLAGPRYAGAAPATANRIGSPALRLVTFNIRHGVRVDSALSVFRNSIELHHADIVALQEVDAAATEQVAGALGMAWVYYPATLHPRYDRDFGNAVLSRWPIVADRKLLLPHLGRFRKTARTATAATIMVDQTPIRVYSAHLGTMAEVSPRGKRDQVREIVTDAAGHARVIILGDMNSRGIGTELTLAGFTWPTEHHPRTVRYGNWDHVFLRGIALASDRASGVVADNRRASDHRPVWALVTTSLLP